MILAEGFRIFYRRLAAELYVRLPPDRALELVLAGSSGFPFPDEDLRHLAEALALASSHGFGTITYAQLQSGRRILEPPPGGHVFDLRFLHAAVEYDDLILRRPDVVFIREERQARLGCQQIRFDRDHRIVFDAATAAFQELIDVLRYSGQALEMPTRYLVRGFRAVADDFTLFPVANSGFSSARLERFVNMVAAGWRYNGSTMDPGVVLRWLDQFQGPLREGALALLNYIHATGYYSTQEIATTLSSMLASEGHGAQLVSIQPPGKSEQMLLYEMRASHRTVPLSEAVLGNASHLVCVDDVIGSGDTIVDSLFGASQPNHLSHWLATEGRAVTVLAAVASERGVRRIEADPRGFGRISVCAKLIMDTADGVFAPATRVFPNAEVGAAFRHVCEQFGEQLFPGDGLGWGGCAWGIVTEYNVPDCSLPVIWCENRSLPWSALFPRR